MVENNTDNHETAFTVSVDYVETTTGISAAERSMTTMRCVAEDANRGFPASGTYVSASGKEERGAGEKRAYGSNRGSVPPGRLKECGLCCEIMREDGTMMRTTELLALAKGTI